MNIHAKSGLVAGLLLALAAPAAQAAELKPFNATYRASYNNMAANATMSTGDSSGSRLRRYSSKTRWYR